MTAKTTKKPVDYSSKLYIGNELAAFDRKDRDYFDSMTDEEKKTFSPYLMIRWGSCIQGDADMQAYYVMSTNENLNKHFFDINTAQHKKLQWLMATTVSPGMGSFKHQWIPPKKKTADNKTTKFIRELYPHLKDDEIKLLADLNDKSDLKDLARELGWDEKRIKSDL
jgi:hypothetical protein